MLSAGKQVMVLSSSALLPRPELIDLARAHGGQIIVPTGALIGFVLIRVFRLQERLKSLGKEDGATFSHVHVVGAGTMGADIAGWCVASGMEVSLQDISEEQIKKGIAGKIAVETGELETLIFTRPKVGYMLNVGKEATLILPPS